jgi:hypothetical protein
MLSGSSHTPRFRADKRTCPPDRPRLDLAVFVGSLPNQIVHDDLVLYLI